MKRIATVVMLLALVLAVAGCAATPSRPTVATPPTTSTPEPTATVPSATRAPSDPSLVKVPNVHGKWYDVAEKKLKSAGLKYKEKINAEVAGPTGGVGVGEVYKQRPRAGEMVPKGTVVSIYFQIYE